MFGLPRIDHQSCCIDGLSALHALLLRYHQALIDGINTSGEMFLNKVRIIIWHALHRDRHALIDGINVSGEMFLNAVRIIICL